MKNAKNHLSHAAGITSASVLKRTIPLALMGASIAAYASTDYGPARWISNCGKYNTSGYGHKFYVEHDIEGYYAGTCSYLAQCSVSASIHYLVNGKADTSSDFAAGHITQEVRDAYYAWHALCWNGHSMGTEHEGFASNPAWYTEALYQASGTLTRSKANKYGMTKDRNHIIAHSQRTWTAWANFASGHFGINPYCNTHGDPGPYWNWSHFMAIVNGAAPVPKAPSGLTAAVVSASQIKLSWLDNSSNETGFKVERSLSSGSGFAQIATTGAGVKTYTAGGLASGTKYYFKVRAYNASGNSAYTGVASATTKDTIPAAPGSLTATAVSDVQINLTWTQSMPNEDGFRIYRSTDGTTFAQIATAGINATSYNNTGLSGNKQYWYKVCAYNTAGNSAFTAVATDITGPQAPSNLTVSTVAGTANWNKLDLAWTDNSGTEAGFRVERATASAGPFTQIVSLGAGVATYQDSGLAAVTTYYYRVRAYNANANSAYTAVVSKATPNAPPILTAIGNKTVAVNNTLAFTCTSSDPNAPAASAAWTGTWEGNNDGDPEVVFRQPINSGSTSSFIDTSSTNYSMVKTGAPSGVGGTKALKSGWTFKTGLSNYWVRYTTANAPSIPNLTIALDQAIKFRWYPTRSEKLGLIIRETGTTAAYGANGGTTGVLEYVGVTNVVNSCPIPNKLMTVSNWNAVTFNIPFEPQWAFTGDGKVDETGAKGVLDAIIIRGEAGANTYMNWLDDFQVMIQNYRTFSLDAGAPAGASISRRSGKFSWTPTTEGTYNITIRVTDNLGAQDYETIVVTVVGTQNVAPVLSAIGNKTVNELSALTFTASASDANAGQVLTYSLDAGAPSGASINPSTGAFTWTPTEAQGGLDTGIYPITVRVTDNGSPALSDYETIQVSVREVNTPPVLAPIANQTINVGDTFNATASATDSDTPAGTITYSLLGPAGMTIDANTGAISWTPGVGDAGDVDQVTVTATDHPYLNNSPSMSSSKTFTVTVVGVNTAPTLAVGTKYDYNPLAKFDELDDEGTTGHNNAVLFRVPYFSGSTTAFLDSTSYSYVTNDFPRDDGNNSYQALYVNCTFLTGTTSPWCRLCTFTSSTWTNTYAYPNPTIDLTQHIRFKIWSDKSIKVALGVRETGTQNPLGFDGGTTGTIEWVGAGSVVNGQPQCTRTINASNWTQVDLNLPTEPKAAFTGNGVLDGIKGTLESLVVVPNGGMGNYTVYLDDFEALITSTANPITIDTGDTLTLTATGTDTDIPRQDLTYSMIAGPTNAEIDDVSGLFTWTPDPTAASQAIITLQVTDNGSPALSASQTFTVNVTKVNTPPRLGKTRAMVLENGAGGTINFDMTAEDDDLPGDTLTFSLTSAPAGMTINPSTGTVTWTPPAGVSTNYATVRVADNGTPSLWDEQTVKVVVVPANTAPTLTLAAARAEEKVVTFETFTNATPNEQVMFKKPGNSATTSSFVDTAVTNYSSVTTSFPAGNANAGGKVLRATWNFKTGTTGYWVRLTTANTTLLPNPTFNASARLKFDIYTTKALKVCLGIRETGTTAENGANGGTTGTIEWVGASSVVSGCPQPSRTINASNWTTVEFDIPNEPKCAFTGDGILNGGQQVLENLALVGAGGTGTYNVYLDNFNVVTTTALPGTVNMKANSTLTFSATGSDPDPGSGLTFGIDADFQEAHTNAVMTAAGAFSWTPTSTEVGTSTILVTAEDNPTNGGIPKSSPAATVTLVVNADTLGAQAAEEASFVAGGDSITLTWASVAGTTYKVQMQRGAEWTDVQTVTATGTSSSVVVSNDGDDSSVRVIEAGAASE